LLNICTNYGVDFDVKYNAKKSVVMVCRTKADMDIKFPAFHLSGQTLAVSNSTKYLGHIITDMLVDDADLADRGDCSLSKLTCWLENSTTVHMMLKLICLEPTAPRSEEHTS